VISTYRKHKMAREISAVTGWTFKESYFAYFAMVRVMRSCLLGRKAFYLPNIGTFVFKARNPRLVPPRTLPTTKSGNGPRQMPATIHKKRVYVRFKAFPRFTHELNSKPHPKDPEPAPRASRRRQEPPAASA
jgi:nucleoid DNA-binding protein